MSASLWLSITCHSSGVITVIVVSSRLTVSPWAFIVSEYFWLALSMHSSTVSAVGIGSVTCSELSTDAFDASDDKIPDDQIPKPVRAIREPNNNACRLLNLKLVIFIRSFYQKPTKKVKLILDFFILSKSVIILLDFLINPLVDKPLYLPVFVVFCNFSMWYFRYALLSLITSRTLE